MYVLGGFFYTFFFYIILYILYIYLYYYYYFACNRAFEQGHLEPWRYINAFIIISIIPTTNLVVAGLGQAIM